MLKIQKLTLAALMVGAVISGNVSAEDKLKPISTDEASYAVGVLMGSELQSLINQHKEAVTYDKAKILAAVQDVLDGKVQLAKNDKVMNTLQDIDSNLRIVANNKLRKAFSSDKGIEQTQSGLLYRVEKTGSGETIKPTDTVKVHYVGKLLNGTEFDSSIKRGEPAEFRLDQVIPGWTEGLQKVKKGGKIELVIPPELGYGKRGTGAIPPNSPLYFEVEVLDVTSSKD